MDSTNQPTLTNPGIQVLQLIVHRPMADLQWLCEYLTLKCVRYVAREHDPDEGCNRVHCHFAIEYKHTKQALTKFLNSKDIAGSDNFGILSVCKETKIPYDFKILSTYIIKGILNDTVKYHGATREFIEECALNRGFNKEGSQPGKKTKYDEWEEIKKDGFKKFNSHYYTFDEVRKFVMYWYWKRDGKLPHPPSYKRHAGSLYFALTERDEPNRSSSIAMDEIMEKFY